MKKTPSGHPTPEGLGLKKRKYTSDPRPRTVSSQWKNFADARNQDVKLARSVVGEVNTPKAAAKLVDLMKNIAL